MRLLILTTFTGLTVLAQQPPALDKAKASFFITSAGSGNGADLGGLAGADAHCQKLATAAGIAPKTWRAYLSTQAEGDKPAVHAKDRIGAGPWFNIRGEQVAKSVADLHSAENKLGLQTSLTEKGEIVAGRGYNPNTHDILTGSKTDGTAFAASEGDKTCKNWTSSGDGAAQIGHHDRTGGGTDGTSWNSAHPTQGCSQPKLVATGGTGRFYCFAQ
jgi:hypothetical protein